MYMKTYISKHTYMYVFFQEEEEEEEDEEDDEEEIRCVCQFQCVAVCYNVLQRVAECCSVL